MSSNDEKSYKKILEFQKSKLDDFIKHIIKINNCFINIKNKHEKYVKEFKKLIDKGDKTDKGNKQNIIENNKSIDKNNGNIDTKQENINSDGNENTNGLSDRKTKMNELINRMIDNNNVMFFINGELENFEPNIYKLNKQEENTLYELKKIYSSEKEQYNNRKLLLLFMLSMVEDYTYETSEIEKVNESLYKNNLLI